MFLILYYDIFCINYFLKIIFCDNYIFKMLELILFKNFLK